MPGETLFCVQCGTPGAGDARFCGRCGRPMSEGAAPPSTPVAAQARTKTAKGLWNPNAAVLWSVVFTPALALGGLVVFVFVAGLLDGLVNG